MFRLGCLKALQSITPIKHNYYCKQVVSDYFLMYDYDQTI